MYNRYSPREDGSYRRNRVSEIKSQSQHQPAAPPPIPQERPIVQPPPISPPQHHISGFLRQLLPKQLETADLVVLLLLLLMAGDNEEEKSNALLTMALYFIL